MSKALKKPALSFWQIWNMSFGFLGIQFGWGLQMGNMSAIYEYLGASPDAIPMLWLAAPLTGLIVQPIIGYFSDNTWSTRFGRRKPYFFIGALLASAMLIIMPHSSSIWMAAGMLWILDASINISMEPFRAFVADMLPREQYSKGYSMQAFFIGLGAVLSAALPWFFLNVLDMGGEVAEGTVPLFVQLSFLIGGIAFFVAVMYTILTTKEYPPSYFEESEDDKLGYFAGLALAFKNMPDSFVKLAPVQFFTWMGLFLMWFYFTVTITETVFGAETTSDPAYGQGIVWGNLCFGFYSLVTFIFALAMPAIAQRIGNSRLHALCLLIGGIGLVSVSVIANKWLLFLSMGGVGIAWASIVSMPYAMIANDIPSKQMGIFMGLFNMFIVIPEILAALFFGSIMKNVFGNEKIYAIITAGVLLLIAAGFTLLVKDKALEE
jgi:maltose/moltooligosaccharide transporter